MGCAGSSPSSPHVLDVPLESWVAGDEKLGKRDRALLSRWLAVARDAAQHGTVAVRWRKDEVRLPCRAAPPHVGVRTVPVSCMKFWVSRAVRVVLTVGTRTRKRRPPCF
jgi:hypothetical protein